MRANMLEECGDSAEVPSAAAAEIEPQAPAPSRIAVIGSYTIVTFRGWLIEEMVVQGNTVFACAPKLRSTDMAKLAAAGATYHPIGLERTGLNPFQDLGHLFDLAALLRRLRIDVVVAHTTKAMIVGCLAARLAHVPRIFAIVEGLGYTFTPGRELKRRFVRAVLGPTLKIALGVCSGVFVLNSEDRAYLMGLGILSPRQNVTQIAGTGIDLDHYAYVPPTPGLPRFLLIARLIRDKGVFEYVEAARLVKAKHPEACFRLLGSLDDHPGAVTRAQIAAWEREGLVEYLGITDDVRPYLADCSAFVLPSYREGLPRTIMEAMAVGRAVVTTNVVGCRDAVEDRVTGVLLPAQDARALAEAIERLLEEPDLVAAMGRRGRQRAETHFAAGMVNAVMMKAMGLECAQPRI